LRLLLYGNTCNVNYVIAKYVRRAGVDTQLLVDSTVLLHRPESEDPALRGNYPEWIRDIGEIDFERLLLFPGRRHELVGLLSDCDALIVSGFAPVVAQWTGKPYVFAGYGGDFDLYASREYPRMAARQAIPRNPLKGVAHVALALWLNRLQRKGLQAAARVNYRIPGQYSGTDRLMKDLGLDRRRIYIPLPLNTDKYSPDPGASDARDLRGSLGGDVLFFSPTRHLWGRLPPGRYVAEFKNNHLFIMAFARLCHQERVDGRLVLVNKGPTFSDSMELVRKLGIQEKVVVVWEMARADLITYYRAADAVLDQVAKGGMGATSLEALSCGTPLISYVKDLTAGYGEQPPVLSADSEEAIFGHMVRLAREPAWRTEIGHQSREWLVKYHSGPSVASRYVDLFEKLLMERQDNRRSFPQPGTRGDPTGCKTLQRS